MEKLSKHEEGPQDTGTQGDGDGGDRDSTPAEQGMMVAQRCGFHPLHGGKWLMLGGGGRRWAGRGRAGLHRLQIQRLTLHPGRPFGQLPDATSVLGLCHSWVSALTLSQLLPLGPSGRGSSTISFDSFLHRGDQKDLAKPRALGGAWWQSERRAGIWSPAASPAPGEAGGAVRGCVYVHCSPGH